MNVHLCVYCLQPFGSPKTWWPIFRIINGFLSCFCLIHTRSVLGPTSNLKEGWILSSGSKAACLHLKIFYFSLCFELCWQLSRSAGNVSELSVSDLCMNILEVITAWKCAHGAQFAMDVCTGLLSAYWQIKFFDTFADKF